MNLYGELTKVIANPDGTLTVSGVASTEDRDSQGEVVLAEAMKQAIPEYMRFGAVREMHQPKAAGTALRIEVNDTTKATNFEALVVDPVAVKKVQTGTYKGFSIGGKVTKRAQNDHTVIEGIQLTEISLVDRPANPEACIQMWKGEDIQEPAAEEPAADQEEVAMSEPETQGAAEASATPEPEVVEKAGAKYSQATKTALKALRAKAAELAECMKAFDDIGEDEKEEANEQQEKAEPAGDLAKVAGEQLAKLQAENDSLKAELEQLKAMPEAPKGALKAITKSADDALATAAGVEDDSPLALMKRAQSNPLAFGF